MRRAVVALACVAFPLVVGVALARSDAVTLSLSQYRNENGVGVLVFSGTVSSGSVGQTVELVGRDCGGRGYRILSETQTRAGGGWRIENPESTPPWRSFSWRSGMTFRARWGDELSEPIALRLPAGIGASKIAGRRAWRVFVSSSPLVPMAGRLVELQRSVGTSWVRFQRKRLVHKASFTLGPYNNEAVFPVERRGLRLRAFLPRASALPCFLPAASDPWHS